MRENKENKRKIQNLKRLKMKVKKKREEEEMRMKRDLYLLQNWDWVKWMEPPSEWRALRKT